MDELTIKENVRIEDMIYEIRGVQVMLDSDLAKLYGVETKRINEAVNRNLKKFPEKYSWRLTDIESKVFWSQIATKKMKGVVAGIKILEYLRKLQFICLQQY